eukprot:COSAG06_NODE_5514_length_3431_cov_27.989496_2_plen_88_part_00
MKKAIIIRFRLFWLLSWLPLLVLPPTARSRACLRACLWPLPLLRCFPAAGERTRGNSRLRHALTLFLSLVLRVSFLCAVFGRAAAER